MSYFRLRTEAPTISRPAPILLDLRRLPDGSGELLHVKGAVGIHEKPRTHWRAVRLPARYAVSILRSQLEAQGVRVHGGVQFGAAPEGAIELLRFPGAPVAEMVRRLNKYSNNFIAEQLFKQLGADWSGGPGSWESGSQAVRELLTATGGVSARDCLHGAVIINNDVQTIATFDRGFDRLGKLVRLDLS